MAYGKGNRLGQGLSALGAIYAMQRAARGSYGNVRGSSGVKRAASVALNGSSRTIKRARSITKRKKVQFNRQSFGVGNHNTRYIRRRRANFQKYIQRLTEPGKIMTQQGQFELTSAADSQGVDYIPYLRGYLSQNFDSSFRNYFNEFGVDASLVSQQEHRLNVDWLKVEVSIRNHTTIPAWVWVYDIVAKKDQREDDILQDWKDGCADDGTDLFPLQWPIKHSRFHQMYKVVGRRRKFMNPGDILKHNIHIRNQECRAGRLYDYHSSHTIETLGQLTRWVMIRTLGTMAHDNVGKQHYAPVTLGVQYVIKCMIRDNENYLQYATTLNADSNRNTTSVSGDLDYVNKLGDATEVFQKPDEDPTA